MADIVEYEARGRGGLITLNRPAARHAGHADLETAGGGFAGFAYRDRKKPVIVAVDGLATAGGCEIVLAADLVVATTRSSFGLAEVKRHLIAGARGLFL